MKPARVLVVDDHGDLAKSLCDGLEARGFDAVPLTSFREARAAIERAEHDALVTDLRLGADDGLELVTLSRRCAPESPVLVMTAFSAVATAVESIRRGAYHYVTKPFEVDELALFLTRALDEVSVRRERTTLRATFDVGFAAEHLLGTSPAMRQVVDLVRRLAQADVSVLVLGETGTGKGVVAQALHAEGRRAKGPFIPVNCAALPEALLESELFGHVRGAFTGAATSHVGLFEQADGGTLFLDEVAEMPPALQAKLLHVLETGRIRPLGAERERQVDVRIVAATHRDLRARAAQGLFREDLRFRLDVVSIELPPLRHRPGDLSFLSDRLLQELRARHPTSAVQRLSPEALQVLQRYDWPGNVRELKHALERAVLLGPGPAIRPEDLPRLESSRGAHAEFSGEVEPLRALTRRYVTWALGHLGGRKAATAEALDIDIKTLNRHLVDEST
jgi:two-component system response regulator HydG